MAHFSMEKTAYFCVEINSLTVLAAGQAGAAEIIASDLSPPPLAIAARLWTGQTIYLSAKPTALDMLATPKGSDLAPNI